MKTHIRSLLFLFLSSSAFCADRIVENFNPAWRFLKADPAGAAAPAFDDSSWTTVSTPHTYNDIDTFDDWSLPGHRGEQNQWSGRTWYRKTFNAPAAWSGKKIFIEFEGVRQFAEVYLNGVKLGTAKGGFTPFGFDLTAQIKPGSTNVLAVMADNSFQKDPMDPSLAPQAATTAATHPKLGELSKKLMEQIPDTLEELQANQVPWNNPHWHPAHGGIYRNVRLIVTDPLHISLPLYSFLQTEGPYVYATDISADTARIGLEVPVCNDRASSESITINATITDDDGKEVLQLTQDLSMAAGAREKLTLTGTVSRPRLWEPGYPHLYRVSISLRTAAGIVDTTAIPLGIRAIRWDADTGLWINTAHCKLHGWGQKSTNEWPGLGVAQPDWLQAYTMELMKNAGGNFVRWGHVPGSPAQITAGDQLGIVALQPGGDGEHDTKGGAWALRVANFRDVLIYFRNNPSIFIWEGGNQKVSREHAAQLRGLMDKYDPHGGRAYAHRRADKITAEFMDVGIGTEGGREIAGLPVVEGEYNREESPRRVWDDASPPNFGYPEAKGQTYQLTAEQFAANQVRHYVTKLGALNHAGGANWLFTDSTSGGRVGVEVARTSGEVDGVRLPKEAYYVCQVMFTDEPRVHIIGHWSYPANTKKTIYVAANTGGEVELLVNGRSLGRAKPENGYLYKFPDVAFAPGEIKAVAFTKSDKAAATASIKTAGPAVALKLTPIVGPAGFVADGADVALFDIEAVDANGARVPTFQQRVDFSLDGPGIWRGGYNSGKINSINNTWLDLECGVNRVAVRSTLTPGSVTLRVRGEGLRPAESTVTARQFGGGPPAFPKIPLPSSVQRQPQPSAEKISLPAPAKPAKIGRFTKAFNYSGPSASAVHVETKADNGRNAYVDVESAFVDLPSQLTGADWAQAADADALYHAVDLIELTVVANTTITIAHDDRLPTPPWLTRDFKKTNMKIKVKGQSMTLFTRECAAETSLTFGPNTEDSSIKSAHMYLVFINRSS
jgi:beta-galactosidase